MGSGASPFGSATLVMQGPGGKIRVEITGDRTTVGRTRDNEVVLQDPAVSSHHCELVSDRTGLVVRDLNSSNGTYINGRRIQAGPIYDGDALKIGQYQGRIAVRRIDGKPLKPPGAMGPAIVVSVVVALVVGGGVIGFQMYRAQQEAERTLFAEYEEKAREFASADPCKELQATARELQSIERGLDEPKLGRRGRRLVLRDRRHNEKVLEASKAREPLLAGAVEKLGDLLEQQKAAVDTLNGYAAKFSNAERAAGVQALQAVYAARVQATEELLGQLRKHSTQVTEYNELLDTLNRKADRAAYDALDGHRFRLDPAKLANECSKAFGQSQQDILLRVVQLTP